MSVVVDLDMVVAYAAKNIVHAFKCVTELQHSRVSKLLALIFQLFPLPNNLTWQRSIITSDHGANGNRQIYAYLTPMESWPRLLSRLQMETSQLRRFLM
jgi:hypothetical protein